MASLMTKGFDIQRGVEIAWHKLTEVMTPEEMAAKGWGFDFIRHYISTHANENPGALTDLLGAKGWYWIVSDDNLIPIGKPQYKSFGFLTNEQLMNVVRETLKGTGATIASLGTFADRTKRYVSIKVGSEWDEYKVGGRVFQNNLNLMDAIDGSMPLIAKGSNTTVVCQNTFNQSLAEASDFKLSLRHTAKHALPERIENFQQAIDAYHGASALFKKLFESAENIEIKEEQARNVFAGFLGNEDGEKLSTKTRGTVDRLTTLFNNGLGNNGRTGADLLSAVTDFYSHESSGTRGVEAQFTSSEVGSGNKRKTEFFEAVSTVTRVKTEGNNRLLRTDWQMSENALNSLADLGEKSLSLAMN